MLQAASRSHTLHPNLTLVSRKLGILYLNTGDPSAVTLKCALYNSVICVRRSS